MPYNILVIHTDDQEPASIDIQSMPYLASNPHGNWVAFPNATLTQPLCYPIRCSYFTGLRTDHHRMDRNVYPDVNGSTIAPMFDEDILLAKWLSDAGYSTAMIGKYLNAYPWSFGSAHVPAGWDRWWVIEGNGDIPYTGYNISDDGVGSTAGSTDADYATDAMTTQAVSWLSGRAEPWCMTFAPTSPHKPFTPAPRHASAPITLDDPVEFNPADLTGKPAWLQSQPLLNTTQQAQMRTDRIAARRCLLSVDEAVESLIDQIVANGQLDNTVIIYMSDNGQAFGRWRLMNTKNTPWQYCIDPSLRIRFPGATQRTETAVVSTLDLTASMVAWADASPVWPLDGVDITSTITDGTERRSAVESRSAGGSNSGVEPWWSLRTTTHKLIEWPDSNEFELYDLNADPFEQTNIWSAEPTLAASMGEQLAELKHESAGQKAFRDVAGRRRTMVDVLLP